MSLFLSRLYARTKTAVMNVTSVKVTKASVMNTQAKIFSNISVKAFLKILTIIINAIIGFRISRNITVKKIIIDIVMMLDAVFGESLVITAAPPTTITIHPEKNTIRMLPKIMRYLV
jgi:hypothetical protein